jgi:hypothetical protein
METVPHGCEYDTQRVVPVHDVMANHHFLVNDRAPACVVSHDGVPHEAWSHGVPLAWLLVHEAGNPARMLAE